jgi:hypothetical protein
LISFTSLHFGTFVLTSALSVVESKPHRTRITNGYDVRTSVVSYLVIHTI